MIIHVESNNIPSDTPQTVAQKLTELFRYIKRIMPTTKIYFCYIWPKLNERYIQIE